MSSPTQSAIRIARPRDAASLILIDRSGARPKVLMGRRHERHVFMPGFMVFPGGRLEAGDRSMQVYGALASHTERSLMARTPRPSPAKARALALCAIRETFEETGILIGASGLGKPDSRSKAWRGFIEHAIYPAPEALHFVARAITPSKHPRRFDTRFFMTDASNIADRVDGIAGPESELVELKWLDLAETAGENLASITRTVLSEIEQRLAKGLDRPQPVPFFHEWRGQWRRDEV